MVNGPIYSQSSASFLPEELSEGTSRLGTLQALSARLHLLSVIQMRYQLLITGQHHRSVGRDFSVKSPNVCKYKTMVLL